MWRLILAGVAGLMLSACAGATAPEYDQRTPRFSDATVTGGSVRGPGR